MKTVNAQSNIDAEAATAGVADYVNQLAADAAAAADGLRAASAEQKNAALRYAAAALRNNADAILDANQRDLSLAKDKGRDAAFIDRLTLTQERIEDMASAVETVAAQDDPVGRVLARFDRPNGLVVERVSVPIGVIGMVFESRPNVGADASGLCIKSGNAIVLRAGSESLASSEIIVKSMKQGLKEAGLNPDGVQLIETTDRAAVTALLRCDRFIDLVIPRGGRGLVELVRDQASVPTLLHLDGNCHTYIHEAADIDRAVRIVRDAKLRRTGICGATESLVIDQAIAPRVLPALLDAMPEVEFRGDAQSHLIDGRIKPASEDDFATEYLGPTLSVKISTDLDQAMTVVSRYSSGHTDAIVTEDTDAAQAFLTRIDSAVVMHNASTQFSDGGEFGMGAEIGIATGKLHARGPVGAEQLTTFKYRVLGSGQIRGGA